MALHVFVFLLMVCLLLSVVLLWRLDWFHFQPTSSRGGAKRTTLHRLLKPRCPDDCPACRLVSTASSGVEPAPAPVRPWREVKSRRGAPKRIHTEGFACPNQQCSDFGITDAHVHALVGDGKHGRAEQIQTFRCQACHTTFTARRNTALYRLKTPSNQIAMVLTAPAEGLDPSAAERVAGLPTNDQHEPERLVLANMHRPCTNASLAISSSRICSWMNCAPGCAAPGRCSGSGWPLILAQRFFLCSIWVPARRTWHTCSSTRSERAWPPFCLPLFTSDGLLNVCFYASLRSFWSVAGGGSERAECESVAGGGGLDLRAGEKKLTFGASW
jgi:hypothetical protein